DFAVDAYEVPSKIREIVTLRDTFEVFPFSALEARGLDADHTVPFKAGAKKQTRASNLGSLSRRVHRAKTHGGFQLIQLESGEFVWKTPRGQHFLVGPGGTINLNPIKLRKQKLPEQDYDSDADPPF
ncbi:MAG: hypothetical protein FWD80_04150, partial [Propionibacteriaceae bacterium]|nr:hypothetical protein [Propionibacteriaceae bacterium]